MPRDTVRVAHRVPCPLRRIAAALACLALVAALAFVAWALTPLGPDTRAEQALAGGDGIIVTRASFGWVFAPSSTEPTRGVVIYPGGRIDPRSYAPLAIECVKVGALAVIVRMPLNLAVLDPSAADAVIETYPGVRSWVLMGHSLGGAMAASHVREQPSSFDGLIMLGAYPPATTDLTAYRGHVGLYAGTLDSVIDTPAVAAAKQQLPPGALIAWVEGANHSQWGSYGLQRGDTRATIPPDVQTAIAVDAVRRAFGEMPADGSLKP